jgi:hypothetical protein
MECEVYSWFYSFRIDAYSHDRMIRSRKVSYATIKAVSPAGTTGVSN